MYYKGHFSGRGTVWNLSLTGQMPQRFIAAPQPDELRSEPAHDEVPVAVGGAVQIALVRRSQVVAADALATTL